MPRDAATPVGSKPPRWAALRAPVLRLVQLGDLFPVLALAKAYHARSGEADVPFDDATAAVTIARFIAQQTGFGLVAERDGGIVGFIGVYVDRSYLAQPTATNHALYAGEGRAAGVVGAQLIHAAVNVARDAWRARRFHFCGAADFDDDGRTARRLHNFLVKRLGFRPTGPTMTLSIGG